MTNLGYLVAAYAIIWLAFFAYCYRLARRQEELRERLEALRQDRKAPAKSPSHKATLRQAEGGNQPT